MPYADMKEGNTSVEDAFFKILHEVYPNAAHHEIKAELAKYMMDECNLLTMEICNAMLGFSITKEQYRNLIFGQGQHEIADQSTISYTITERALKITQRFNQVGVLEIMYAAKMLNLGISLVIPRQFADINVFDLTEINIQPSSSETGVVMLSYTHYPGESSKTYHVVRIKKSNSKVGIIFAA